MADSEGEDDLPPGWEERATASGDIYYVNHVTKSTQWVHPRTEKRKIVPVELPYGWTKLIDSDGKITFSQESANIHTYTDPRLAFSTDHAQSNSLLQKYNGFSQALEILHGIDLSNKVAIVTGANSGIGYETAYSLALHGCKVIFACRLLKNAKEAVSRVKKVRSKANCEAMKLDLSSINTVKEFCDNFKKEYRELHILVLNAGVFGVPYTLTKDGFESTFQICHLSHFCLVKLLQENMLSACFSRIVIVSSESHRFADLNIENLNEKLYCPKKNEFWSLMAYNNAKLCNLLFASKLHRELYHKGVNVYVVHPGNIIHSNLCRNYWVYRILFSLCSPFTKSLQQAASTSVFCSTSPSLEKISGVYLNNCRICIPSEKARSYELSEKLWLLSENLLNKLLS